MPDAGDPDLPPEFKAKLALLGTRVRPYATRVGLNLSRAYHLVGDHFPVAPEADTPSPNPDVLRAAVVFLHATLEDFLRTIAVEYVPMAAEEDLNEIPLFGSRGHRPEKFFLGTLAKFRKYT